MADGPIFHDPPPTAPATHRTPAFPQSLSSLLPAVTQSLVASRPSGNEEIAPEERRRRSLERWTYLAPTPTLVGHLEEARNRLHAAQERLSDPQTIHRRRQYVALAEEAVEDGVERDQAIIDMQRPEGCWCFGRGGRDQAIVCLAPDEAEPIGQWEWRQGSKTANQPVAWFPDEIVMGVTCPYCPEGREMAERKREIARGLRAQQKILPATGWLNSQIPSGFQTWRLETSPVGDSMPHLLVTLSTAQPSSWVFEGEVSRGKTGLAVGLGWRWREERLVPTVLFQNQPALMNEIKATFDRKDDGPTTDEVIKKYGLAPFLILDDMGAAHSAGTGWSDDILYQIVGDRHANGRPTIFTTNKSRIELLDYVGDRVYQRMEEMTNPDRWVTVTGPNLRELQETERKATRRRSR